MKPVALLLLASMTTVAFAAESSVTLKKVHLCCDSCVRGAEKSIKSVPGVTMTADKKAETVTLTAADKSALQKAANALAEGGYFGVSDDSELKPVAKTGAKGQKVHSLNVAGVHLCCGGCVNAVERATKNTPGATGHSAKKNASVFSVTGDFDDQKFFEALQHEGLSGKVTTHAPDAANSGAKEGSDHH